MKVGSKKLLLVVIVSVVLVLVGIFFFWTQHEGGKKVVSVEVPVQKTIPEKVVQVIEKAGKKTVLPENEVPNVATVSDIAKLQGQEFFAKAQKGDKVLIYTIARKAFLYRPSTDEIINEAPVEIENGTLDASESALIGASASSTSSGALRIKY